VITVIPSCWLISRSSSITLAASAGSRLDIGSSARMVRGSWTSARAMATRCCWPA
jgi:hypothetical protein